MGTPHQKKVKEIKTAVVKWLVGLPNMNLVRVQILENATSFFKLKLYRF